jgi:beta-galactosidase
MWNGVQTGNDGLSNNWNRQPGTEVSLYTFTNADEVELRLNGKSLGRKQNPKGDPKHRNQIRWDGIKYADGKLLAIAYNNGKDVAHHQIETVGKAVRLSALPEDTSWQADGTDLMHVRIEAIDSKGRRVPMAQDELKFTVEGDAQIVAVSNGDINSEELNVTDHRRLYNGSALVILRAGKTPSKITLKTSSAAFKTIATKLQTSAPL